MAFQEQGRQRSEGASKLRSKYGVDRNLFQCCDCFPQHVLSKLVIDDACPRLRQEGINCGLFDLPFANEPRDLCFPPNATILSLPPPLHVHTLAKWVRQRTVMVPMCVADVICIPWETFVMCPAMGRMEARAATSPFHNFTGQCIS